MRHYSFNKYIPRLMALLLAVTLLLPCIPAVRAEGESGACGEGLSWSLSTGMLVISGSGAMSDYSVSNPAPWYSLREEILQVSLPEGLTSIGSLAFYQCHNLTTVTIPGSVARIGSFAFAGCSGMQMLDLGAVQAVGESAFEGCVSLVSLSLPGTLTSIGTKAFYRCESIPAVTVPASVTSIGNTAFGYCKSLVSANVQASISTIPEYLFYGCSSLSSVALPDTTSNISGYAFRGCSQLNSVHYAGTEQSLSQIQNTIIKDVPEFDGGGTVTSNPASGLTTSTNTWTDESGNVTQEDVIVVQGSNVSITMKTETTEDGDNVEYNVTVEEESGWKDAEDFIQAMQPSGDENQNAANKEVTINTYVKGSDEIDPGFVETATNSNANLTITTQNGSVWRIDGSSQNAENPSGSYNLSYVISAGTQDLNSELGTDTSFAVDFKENAQVNSEVLIRVGTDHAQQEATLVQRADGELRNVQTVVVDKNGYAHFYLGSVEKETDYYIAMNLLQEESSAIVPSEMLPAYGVDTTSQIRYEVTGRTSSWGMGLGQVMGILAAVMVTVVILVGFVMYLLNKRRLKNGYVPDWDEDDYE